MMRVVRSAFPFLGSCERVLQRVAPRVLSFPAFRVGGILFFFSPCILGSKSECMRLWPSPLSRSPPPPCF